MTIRVNRSGPRGARSGWCIGGAGVFAWVLTVWLFVPVPHVAAGILVDFIAGNDYVTVNQPGQGVSGGAVPWSLTNPRSPAGGYAGPVYYGGATGSLAIGEGTFVVANASPDYINAAAAAGGPGDWVALVPMFVLAEASTLTNLTLRARPTGSATAQTNYVRVVIEQNSVIYMSDADDYHVGIAPQRTYDVAALNGLSWSIYDPAHNLRGDQATPAAPVSPTNVTAVGALLYNENTGAASRAPAIGMSEFRVWGEVASPEIPGGDYTLRVVNAHGDSIPPPGVYTNTGGAILTNSVIQPAAASGTQLVALGWSMTGHEPSTGVATSFVMTVTNHAELTWLWATQVQFTRTSATPGGSITGAGNGYYPLGTTVIVTSVPANGYDFAGWSGDVPAGQTNDLVLALALDRMRAIQARFETNGEPMGPLQLPSLSNAPAGPRFSLPLERVWPETPGVPDVCLWDGDRFAALAITIDDNHGPDHSWWMARGEETGFKFTWCIISGKVGADGSTWASFQSLAAAGHGMQSHTITHLTSISEDWPGIAWEYGGALTNIEASIPGSEVTVLAYPGGYQNPATPYSTNNNRVVAAHYYIAARGVVGTPNKANQIDYFNTASVGNGTGRGYTDAILYGTSSISWLNNSQYLRGWLCTHFHNVGGQPQAPVWAADLDYIATMTNDLWVGLMDEVVRYGQSRDTATLTLTTNDGRASRFLLSDDMLDSRFDYPLTVKVRCYDHWTDPVALQDGAVIPLGIVTNNGARFALLRVVPDQGEVLVTDRAIDFDGDGVPDWEEAVAGTDPDDPSDFFRLNVIGGGEDALLSWKSKSALSYALYGGGDLIGGIHDTVMAGIPASPPINTITVHVDNAATRYFLLMIE